MTHLSPSQFFEKMVAKDGRGEALLIKEAQFPSDVLSRSCRSTDWEKRSERFLKTCVDLDTTTHLPKGADNWEKEMAVESD